MRMEGETVPLMELYPVGGNRFIAKEYIFVFEFIVGESDKVEKMNVTGDGQVLCETNRTE